MAFKQIAAGRILGEIYMTVIATQGGLEHPGVPFRGRKFIRPKGTTPVIGLAS
jgi:hypothetical protein